MKLSISTLGCPDWDFLKILSEFRAMGIEGIEVRGLDGEMDADKITWFSEENEAKTKELLARYELKIVGFGSSVSFHDEKSFENNLAAGKKAVDICSRMNIPAIRVFGDRIADKGRQDEIVSRVVSGIEELCIYAQDKNVNIYQETHGDFNTAELMCQITDRLGKHKNFGILWDIVNSDKPYGRDYRQFYNTIKPYVRHIHIKDYIRSDDGSYKLCPLGEGDIAVKDIVNMLLGDGFDGYFSLEWEKKWIPELAEPEEEFPHYASFMKKCVEQI